MWRDRSGTEPLADTGTDTRTDGRTDPDPAPVASTMVRAYAGVPALIGTTVTDEEVPS